MIQQKRSVLHLVLGWWTLLGSGFMVVASVRNVNLIRRGLVEIPSLPSDFFIPFGKFALYAPTLYIFSVSLYMLITKIPTFTVGIYFLKRRSWTRGLLEVLAWIDVLAFAGFCAYITTVFSTRMILLSPGIKVNTVRYILGMLQSSEVVTNLLIVFGVPILYTFIYIYLLRRPGVREALAR